MKLDVSDVLYDSSSVSSDSGASQSSRVSHDFLSTLTNSSTPTNNYQERQKVILHYDNARPHVAKPVKTYLEMETLKWEVLPQCSDRWHMAYVAEQYFHSHQEVKEWIDSWIASKDASFFRDGIRQVPESWQQLVASDGQYFAS